MTLPSPCVQGGSLHCKLIITDGPFMKTTARLGGYHLVECQDLEEMLALAGRFPMLHVDGAIEVRQWCPHPRGEPRCAALTCVRELPEHGRAR